MIPNPARDFLAYEQPIIAGRKWTGVASVEGCDRTVDIQINKAKGSKGATTNVQGENPAEPKITFTLFAGWDESGANWVDYFSVWEDFKGVFELPLDAKNPAAITIEHPQFAEKGIRACIVKKIGDLKLEPDGRITITIELVEFKKPEKSGGTPKSVEKDATKKGRPKSAVEERADALDRENAELLNEISQSLKKAA